LLEDKPLSILMERR